MPSTNQYASKLQGIKSAFMKSYEGEDGRKAHRNLSMKQWVCWRYMENKKDVHELLGGGSAGGGKTVLGTYWQMFRRCKYPNTRGLIGRESYTDLSDTTLKTFMEIWNKWGRYNPVFNGQRVTMQYVGHTARFSNGSEILFRWLRQKGQDATNLGSLELTDAFIDEVPEVSKKVKDILNVRIRHKLIRGQPKLMMMCNPSIGWVKWEYVKDRKGRPVRLKDYQKFVRFGLSDNPDDKFATQYRSQLEKLGIGDRARLLDGDWDVIENEKPWFKDASYSINGIDAYTIDPYEPIYLSFDFNISPCTCTAAQYIPGKGLFCFRSHEVDGGTDALCDELEEYEYQDHPAGLIITGDISGKARHSAAGLTQRGEISTDYNIIKARLNVGDGQIKHTRGQNPRLRYSRRVVNYALRCPVVFIHIYECAPLWNDINMARPDSNDGLVKKGDDGMHHADNFRYLNHLVFPRGFKDINAAYMIISGGFLPSTNPPEEEDPFGGRFDSIQSLLK